MAQYKALVGTIVYKTESADGYFTVELSAESEGCELPEIVLRVEMVLLVNLIRKATKKNIVPHNITVRRPFDNPSYEKFLGVKAETGEKNALIFTERDAHVPFVTHNESMWSFFEPELRKRIAELEVDDTISARVRSALVELLPGGECSIDDVCRVLGMSRRTLQRKLKEENTSFQQQLNHTRELLTKTTCAIPDCCPRTSRIFSAIRTWIRFTARSACGRGRASRSIKQKRQNDTA